MTDIAKHAEAILRAAKGVGFNSVVRDAVDRAAILAACTALFDAGVQVGLDAAEDQVRKKFYPQKPEEDWTRRDGTRAHNAVVATLAIRAITPASLRGE
jgi:hypothetical protein